MRKTLRSLVVAAAATAAFSVIPLAAASASATVPTTSNQNWSGYYMTRPGPLTYLGHKGYQPRLDGATAIFTVPSGQRAHSGGSPVYEGAMSAGLGGLATVHGQPETLEQDGVVEVAAKTGPQHYLIFWEIAPFNHEQNFNGRPVYVKPGDKIDATVQPPWMTGDGTWLFSVTVNGKPYSQHVRAGLYKTTEPTTAEVITEWASGTAGVGPKGIAGRKIHGMPDTGTVRYTYAGALVQYTVPEPVPVTQNRIVLDHTVLVWKNPVSGWVPQRTIVYPTAAQATGEFGPGRNAFNTIYSSN